MLNLNQPTQLNRHQSSFPQGNGVNLALVAVCILRDTYKGNNGYDSRGTASQCVITFGNRKNGSVGKWKAGRSEYATLLTGLIPHRAVANATGWWQGKRALQLEQTCSYRGNPGNVSGVTTGCKLPALSAEAIRLDSIGQG